MIAWPILDMASGLSYEELGFSIEADCNRCVPCRKQQQGIARVEVEAIVPRLGDSRLG